MHRPRIVSAAGLLLLLGCVAGSALAEPTVTFPEPVLRGTAVTATVSDPDLAPGVSRSLQLVAGGETYTAQLTGPDPVEVPGIRVGADGVHVRYATTDTPLAVRTIPGWMSLLPPLLAIVLAIVFRQAALALFVGVWVGAGMALGGDPFTAFLRAFDTFLVGALTDEYNTMLVLFTFAMAGMLGVISRAGGTSGLVDLVTPRARSARSGQVTAWVLGLVVFFDDYANTLMVGNTMRPLTDRLRVSREKLSYIVDCTAAPVASLALVSTWIGVEVGLIGDAFQATGIERDAFGAFAASIPYRFYPILALGFVLIVALMGRDFGPMLKAERRARKGHVLRPGSTPLANFENEALEPVAGKPHRWLNAAIPILVMVTTLIVFLWTTGTSASGDLTGLSVFETLKTVLGNADSYKALLWASFLSSAAAILLVLPQRILSLGEALAAWVDGAKSVLPAIIILALAWAIGDVAGRVHTADYLVEALQGVVNPVWLPAGVFVLSGLTAFATGSSWSTMGILMPLVVPLAHTLDPGNDHLLVGTLSSVLAGAVWGDHCSPISDTTVLSSMASSVDHMDHVNTQLPYALLVGGVAVVVGEIPAAHGVPWWLCAGVAFALLAGFLRLAGGKAEEPLELEPGQ